MRAVEMLVMLVLAATAGSGCLGMEKADAAALFGIASGARTVYPFALDATGVFRYEIEGHYGRFSVFVMDASEGDAFDEGRPFTHYETAASVDVTNATAEITLRPGAYVMGFECVEPAGGCEFRMVTQWP